MAENNNVLKLYKGEAHKIRVEKAVEFKDSYFLDAYRQALRCFHDIHVDNEKNRGTGREFNNVIAFCGERGSGKTSAMMSFRDMLAEWADQHKHLGDWAGEGMKDKLKSDLRFVCLDAVDPSRFEPNDRLSGTVLSELYNQYRIQTKATIPSGKLDIQKKLEKAFSKLLKGIQLLSAKNENPFGDPRSHENDFEVLDSIAGAAGLRGAFHNLVTGYLQFHHEEGCGVGINNTYLVIPVDDLDLSVEHAFNLAEDIRKYLHVPNVIILIAMKLDQLRLAVEQANYVRFKGIRKAVERPDPKYIEEMSIMYLEKLVPIPKRIILPAFGKIEDAKQQKVYFGPRLSSREVENTKSMTAESIVLDLIRERTLLNFKVVSGELHPLVPRTIRELQNLLEYLDGFESPTPTAPHTYLEPLRKFQEYFVEYWIPNALGRDEEELVGKIISASPNSKNSVAAHHLGRYLANGWESMNPLKVSKPMNIGLYEHILSTDANNANISLGDVLFLLTELARVDRSRHFGNLIFSVRALYSMEITKLILIGDTQKDQFEGRSDMGDLIGGTYFHPNAFSFVREPIKSLTVDQRYIYWPKAVAIEKFEESRSQAPKQNSKSTQSSPITSFPSSLLAQPGDQIKTRPVPGKNIPHFLSVIQDSIAKSRFDTKFDLSKPTHSQDLEVILSFVYIGELTYYSSFRTDPNRWYLQPTNLTGGKIPFYYLIDFKAFMFWVMVPGLNHYRIYNRRSEPQSRNEADNETYDELNLPEEQPENPIEDQSSVNRSLDSKKILLAKVFQIDVLEQICEVAKTLIDRKRKNTTYPRSLSIDIMDVIEGFEKAMLLIAKQGLSLDEALQPKIEIPEKGSGFMFDDLFYPVVSATARLKSILEVFESSFFHRALKTEESHTTSSSEFSITELHEENTSIAESNTVQPDANLINDLQSFVAKIRILSEGIYKPDIIQLRSIQSQIIKRLPPEDNTRRKILDIPIDISINIFSPKRHAWCKFAVGILEQRIKQITAQ